MVTEDKGYDLAAIRFEIARIAPEFEGAPIVPLGEGMDSIAVLAGEAVVFRFPKHAEAGMGLGRENALLPRLAPTLRLAIPRFDYAGEHSVTGLPFVGYGLIRGEPLHRPLFDSLPDPTKEILFADLAAFLKAVHAFSVAEAAACGVETAGGRIEFIEDLRRARDDVFPLLEPAFRREVERRLRAFLEDDANFDDLPALRHADLWPEHVLFSRGEGRLAGVIDFGDVSIGDPDYDLAFLDLRLGPDFIAGLLRHHPHAQPAKLAAKTRCFALINAIDDVFLGLDRGDQQVVDSAPADLREQCARR